MRVLIINQSSSPAVAGVLAKIAEAAQLGLVRVATDWDLGPDEVKHDPAITAPPAGWSALYVRDKPTSADEEGIEGYHDKTPTGEPVAYCFYGYVPGGELLRDPGGRGASLAGLVTHELVEMKGDRSANVYRRLTFTDPTTGTAYPWVAEEWADPVQESAIGIMTSSGDIVDFSNYVKPNYFNAATTSDFDALGLLKKPLSLLSGGYIILGDGKGQDADVFGRLAVVHHEDRMAAWREEMKAANPASRTQQRRRAA